jgi:general secretion pathway protein K
VSRGRQRGIAVITAMLVVAIATLLAVEIAWNTSLDLRRTEGLLGWEQARQFGYGAEAFAAQVLQESLDEQSATYSRGDDEQFCQGFQFTLDQGGMTGGVCDLQGRFNLNGLLNGNERDPVMLEQFRRLLRAVSEVNEELDIEPETVDVIVESTADWLDPDATPEFNGAEDDVYTAELPPYRAANFWFTSVSEWRAVRGVTPEIYAAVQPLLAALPIGNERPKLNVNTAPLEVLMSLGEDVDRANAEGWIEDSRREPFEDATQFTGLIDAAMSPYLGFSSQYFGLSGLITIGTTQLGMYSLLQSTTGAVVPRLRQFGVAELRPVTDDEEPVAVDTKAVTDTDE